MQKLLSVRETAAALRVSGSMVYALANRGVLPSLRIGTRLLFGEETLEKWVNENMKQGG